MSVYVATARQIPGVLREIGRCREIAFRAAGEGTGAEFDLDRFDSYYQHLSLWDRPARRLAGAYRLGLDSDVLHTSGIGDLYASTLVRIHQPCFQLMGIA